MRVAFPIPLSEIERAEETRHAHDSDEEALIYCETPEYSSLPMNARWDNKASSPRPSPPEDSRGGEGETPSRVRWPYAVSFEDLSLLTSAPTRKAIFKTLLGRFCGKFYVQ
jgi:hypothetical protein